MKIDFLGDVARTGNVDRALTILDEALTTCDRIGHRFPPPDQIAVGLSSRRIER